MYVATVLLAKLNKVGASQLQSLPELFSSL